MQSDWKSPSLQRGEDVKAKLSFAQTQRLFHLLGGIGHGKAADEVDHPNEEQHFFLGAQPVGIGKHHPTRLQQIDQSDR